MAESKDKTVRRRAPHKLSKEHAKRVKDSDAARAKNPNRVGKDAPKRKATDDKEGGNK